MENEPTDYTIAPKGEDTKKKKQNSLRVEDYLYTRWGFESGADYTTGLDSLIKVILTEDQAREIRRARRSEILVMKKSTAWED